MASSPSAPARAPKYISASAALMYWATIVVASGIVASLAAGSRQPLAAIVLGIIFVGLAYAATNGLARKAYLNLVVKRQSPGLYASVVAGLAAERQAREAKLQAEAEARRIAFENSPAEVAKRQAAAYEETLRSGALQPIGVSGLVLAAGEKVYWSEPATLVVHATKTEYVGGYGGVSVRVMRGVSLRSGSFRGHPVKQDVRVNQDSGTLNITDKRIVFVGAAESKEVPLAKMTSMRAFSDGIEVLPANKKAIGFDTGNPHAGIVLERIINHDLGSHGAPAASSAPAFPSTTAATVQVNREVLRVVATQMRDHIAILKADYDTLDGAQPKVVENASIPDYVRWVEAKIAALRDLFGRAEHLLVVDLQEPLTASDVAPARIATAHWLHGCDDVCYGAIAWEKDARSMACPPRLAEAHRRLFGQTLEVFEQIEALPDKIEAIASQETHDGTALSLSSKFTGSRIAALSQAVDAARLA